MATRFYAEAGRIILSKPGYNASPSLPDIRKILDSDWQFSGAIIASGRVSRSQSNNVISFPAQHYIPAAEVLFEEDNYSYHARGTVTTNAIILDIFESGIANYIVYGVSQ